MPQVEKDQDGMELMKFMYSVHYEQDGLKQQSMLKIVTAMKMLFLWYQTENWDLDV